MGTINRRDFLILLIFRISGEQGFYVDKDLSAVDVYPDDEVRIQITVHGYSEQSVSLIPVDAVLAIDS